MEGAKVARAWARELRKDVNNAANAARELYEQQVAQSKEQKM